MWNRLFLAAGLLLLFPTGRNGFENILSLSYGFLNGYNFHATDFWYSFHILSYNALRAMSSSCVPCSAILPFCITTLLSASCTVVSRSEEHTSELHSRQYLVCRLLLEKTASAE